MNHEQYMHRCIQLAQLGTGNVAPNPLVGCVIVCDEKIIGEGWHQQFGGPHAEVNAISSVIDKEQLKKCTLYVNLEPCTHTGKTLPCVDLILKNKIPEVAIGCIDSNPVVSGSGIKNLISAGVKVFTDVLKNESRFLNRRFITFHEKRRPFIILKWAQTKDGIMGDSKKRILISNELSGKLVHKWRSEEAAIMIGKHTAAIDNPHLTVRNWFGKNPLRIVIDRDLVLDKNLNVFDGKDSTLVFTSKDSQGNTNPEFEKINFAENVIEQILNSLYKRNILSVMIEGGTKLLKSFIQAGTWDEARIIVSEKNITGDIYAPVLKHDFHTKEKNGSDVYYTHYSNQIVN